MYQPHIGEWVKIVADTVQHRIKIGTIIKITKERDAHSWWAGHYSVFVVADDISRLNPSVRKILKNIEKNIKRTLDDAATKRPALKWLFREIANTTVEEATRR